MIYEVIIDSGETPNKCTIAPLSDRPDFRLFPVKGSGPLGPICSPILLHHEGECLTTLRGSMGNIQGIASIDCVWRRLNCIVRRIASGPLTYARIPDGFETAYPRRSSKDTDPTTGLATIEAIFTASAVLGNWDTSLLSKYYFGRKFIDINRDRFLELGVSQSTDCEDLPVFAPRMRTSLQRRHDRGKK